MNNKPKMVALVGPTGSGKTALSIVLAKRFSGEILSGDSMQIYRHMNIGTAKPTEAEMEGIPHHLMDFLSPEEPFSVARYCQLAKAATEDILGRGKLPILVGGTGLYIDSFLTGNAFPEMESDPALRRELQALGEREGGKALVALLREFDPESAAAIHENNRVRLIRAIEVYRTSGQTITHWNKLSKEREAPYDVCRIGLTVKDRSVLWSRIDSRVDRMLQDGLLEEVRSLHERFALSQTAGNAIGYKELLDALAGRTTYHEAVEDIKKASRHYAKRQLTWFGRNRDIRWYEIDTAAMQEIVAQSTQQIDDFMKFEQESGKTT